MDVFGSVVASAQVLGGAYNGLARLKRANDPALVPALLDDIRSRSSRIEHMNDRWIDNKTLQDEGLKLLEDFRKLLSLLGCLPADLHNSTAKRSWQKQLHSKWKYFLHENEIDRIQRTILDRKMWMLSQTIEDSFGDMIGSTTTNDHSSLLTQTTLAHSATPKTEVFLPSTCYKSPFIDPRASITDLKNKLDDCSQPRRAAIVGLPGSGKTRLSMEYVNLVHSGEPGVRVFHLQATTEQDIEHNLNEIADTMLLAAGQIYTTSSQIEKWQQLKSEAERLILIVDDLNNDSILYGPRRLAETLLRKIDCRVIFISWSQQLVLDLVFPHAIVTLNSPDHQVSKQLLLHGLAGSSEEDEAELAIKAGEKLSHVPRAILQARAFIHDHGISTAQYLRLLQNDIDRIHLFDYQRGNMAADQTVSGSMARFLQTLEVWSACAFVLLRLLSCLALYRVPRRVFEASKPASLRLDLTRSFRFLEGLSIVQYHRPTDTYTMDPFLRAALRNHLLTTRSLEAQTSEAVEAVLSNLPKKHEPSEDPLVIDKTQDKTSERHLTDLAAYLIHGKQLVDIYQQHPGFTFDTTSAKLAFNIVRLLRERGEHEQSIQYARLTAQHAERAFGDVHENASKARLVLALSLSAAGRIDEAEKEARSVLGQRERLHGAIHSQTIEAKEDLALILERQGRHEESEAMNKDILQASQILVNGPSPQTVPSMDDLVALQNLGITYLNHGRGDEAHATFTAVYRWHRHHLDPCSPTLYEDKSNIAAALHLQHKLEDAWEWSTDVYAWRTRHLGPDHANTIGSLSDLALILQDLSSGDSNSSSDISTCTNDSPSDNTSNNNATSTMINRVATATEHLWRTTLHRYRSTLGPAHPETIRAQNNLAIALHTQGHLRMARDESRAAMWTCRTTWGPGHPHYVRAREHSNALNAEMRERDEKLRLMATSYGTLVARL